MPALDCEKFERPLTSLLKRGVATLLPVPLEFIVDTGTQILSSTVCV
ncbi:hypothetical protein AVEN_275216-1, partial [Araneus ventricosus]